MRFGLSDLEELPSLKEFEALAREALGADDGIAASQEEGEIAEGEALETGAVAEDAALEAEPEAGMDSAAASPSESAPEAADAETQNAELQEAETPNVVAPEQPQESETSAWDTLGEPARDSEGRSAKKAAPGGVE